MLKRDLLESKYSVYSKQFTSFEKPKKKFLTPKVSKKEKMARFRIKTKKKVGRQMVKPFFIQNNKKYIKRLEEKVQKQTDKKNELFKPKRDQNKKVNISDLVERLTKQKELVKEVTTEIKKKVVKKIAESDYQSLMKKTLPGFAQILKKEDYYKHKGLVSGTPLVYLDSQDTHIKRYLKANGFGFITDHRYISFADVIYTNKDTLSFSDELNSKTVINHIYNNRELTCKNRLTKNLKSEQNRTKGLFYPLTFDFAFDDQRQAFEEEHFKIITFQVLRNHISYFKRKRGQLMKYFKKGVKREEKREKQFKYFYANFTTKYKGHIDDKDNSFILSLIHIEHLLDYWKCLRNRRRSVNEDFKNMTGKNINKDIQARITLLSAIKHDYDQCDSKTLDDIGFSEEYWKTPNHYLIYKLYSLHYFFKRNEPMYDKNNLDNVWIVKPSTKSKGYRINLANKLSEVIALTEDKDRIVQKYIERPLLIDNNRKFDIRLWALIKSVNPLEIYYFPEFYLRLCPSSYTRNDLSRIDAHLTNYSLNKEIYSDKGGSVLSKRDFIEFLRASHGVDYEKAIKGQIEQMIVETVVSASPRLIHRENSFELLGFDILLDDKLKPWLLEVNLSPACEARSNFLKKSLFYMTQSLFSLVSPSLFPDQIQVYEEEEEEILINNEQSMSKEVKEEWILLHKGEKTRETRLIHSDLTEICGTALNIQNEQIFSKTRQKLYAATVIQRYWRNHHKTANQSNK